MTFRRLTMGGCRSLGSVSMCASTPSRRCRMRMTFSSGSMCRSLAPARTASSMSTSISRTTGESSVATST